MNKPELDMHTHTLASGHAYNTIREMAKMASKKGLKALGITDHAPTMPGSCHEFYFQNLKTVPRELYKVKLILGSEVNILNEKGEVDLSNRILKDLDIVIASMHTPCIEVKSIEENTSAYINVMKNPYVHIIGHPDDGRYKVNYEQIIKAAKEYGKIIELNNHSMEENCNRLNAKTNDKIILELCKKYSVPIIMDSDAHFDIHIGNFENCLELVSELRFPEELIVNFDTNKFFKLINYIEG